MTELGRLNSKLAIVSDADPVTVGVSGVAHGPNDYHQPSESGRIGLKTLRTPRTEAKGVSLT